MALKKKGVKRARRALSLQQKEKNNLTSEKERIRNTYGKKLEECLIRGLEEIQNDSPDVDMSECDVKILTNNICDVCHDYYGYDRRRFKQRMFEIYVNLKRENNQDLRRKILTKAMSVLDLVEADTIQLAPEELKHKRQIEVERHYIRNVILPTELPQDPTSSTSASINDNSVLDGDDGSTTLAYKNNSFSANDSSRSIDTHGSSSPSSNESDYSTESYDSLSDSDDEEANQNSVDNNENWSADQQGSNQSDIEEESGTLDPPAVEFKEEYFNNVFSQTIHPSVGNQTEKSEDDIDENKHQLDTQDWSYFTLQKTVERIGNLLDGLPGYIAKPFRVPLKCGHKRIMLLMQRSHILQYNYNDTDQP
ncbi:Transcription factor S-II (TFIIS) central domain family protein [Babesia bovis T2Bo]|uniref:Transcription factor S-II (TFIIS) central domain family protein n=1 Tax=Babesia bovis T2Bo TaxID=484906 RepID=UPI001C349297|nr:Transcription factor S-II (TFIIS) central domain family protein [Babesia bovis T2Bo]EDO05288.2 Transcription factor S-II (TFIIS) central domain family protein [Babesia bovis T2Bo]